MKKLLVLLIVAILLVGCEQKKEENNNNVETVNQPTQTTTIQETNIKFEIKNEYIEEKQFVIDPQVDNEGYMDCKIYFWEGKAYYTDGFGNVLRGPYEISGDSITINFNMLDAEYSEKPQQLDVDVHLKMLDETTIIVAETPPPYTVKTSTFVDGSWVFDSGEKEMTFLGFVKDYRFYKVPVVGKIDDTKDFCEWIIKASALTFAYYYGEKDFLKTPIADLLKHKNKNSYLEIRNSLIKRIKDNINVPNSDEETLPDVKTFNNIYVKRKEKINKLLETLSNNYKETFDENYNLKCEVDYWKNNYNNALSDSKKAVSINDNYWRKEYNDLLKNKEEAVKANNDYWSKEYNDLLEKYNQLFNNKE